MNINAPAELRAVLFQTMIGVLEGRISVPQGNTVASLSVEAHKSIRQQWDMVLYASEQIDISNGKVSKLIEME